MLCFAPGAHFYVASRVEMAKNLSDLLGEWDGLIKKHRVHLVKNNFSNKFAVLSKEVDALVVEYKTYTKLWSEQNKVVESIQSQVLAQAEAIGKKLKARPIATKKEKEDGLKTLDNFCKCITHESHEVNPRLLGKEWVELMQESKSKNKALYAVADDPKMISLLKKLADEAKKSDGYHDKLGTANAFANRKTDFEIKPDIEKNMKSLTTWENKEAAEEVAVFLKNFKKALDVVIY
ncbi:hypothetical protein EI613_02880 [Azospirillum sp. 412522]|nr:hypothetical protein [Azospirillum sp. 412522]MBY6260868.1 hypothetical protein [Azospirillum sp. 412522]